VLLYRISKSKYAREISGHGARMAGGRWNLKGTPVVYTSDSTALATLEMLVHVSLNLMPKNISMTIFELPDDIAVNKLSLAKLPKNWHAYPAPGILAVIGSDWINKCSHVALSVPSSITPTGEGKNYLLNPRHPDFAKVKIIDVVPYKFNARLLKG
jgi:RES domain-containing protein